MPGNRTISNPFTLGSFTGRSFELRLDLLIEDNEVGATARF